MNFDDFIQNQGAVTIPNPNYNPRSKKNKGPRTLDIIDLSADRNNLRDVVKKDLETGVRADYDDIKKYERYGVSWNPKDAANGSLDVQLAEAQSNWAKLGNALAQTVVSEIGLGTALGISDLFDAIGQAVGASDHDYTNPVSAKLEEWQDKFNNEVAPIYSRPGAGFGNGTDFGWWMQNIPSIASSLTLLIPAAGGTKLLSMAGKAALKTTKAGAKWLERATRLDRIHKAGHSVGISSRAYETGKLFAKNATTAALSRTMENYQEARQVYNDMYVDVLDSLNAMDDEEYNNFLNRNQNTVKDVDTSNKDEVAKAVARKSSDLTFKADYANTVFDIIELYALRNVAFHGFRNSKVSAAARRLDKNARRFAGKYNTIEELEELVSKQSFGRKAADKLGDIFYAGRTVGMAQASEGIEEAVNYIAQQEGMEVGKSMLSMEANTTFSNRLRQYMNNPELWESAFWGVAGGIVFQGAGSGLARAKTALERKNEKKKNKPDEKTGEDVNANTKWKDLWELPDVKRVKASIENRLAIENDYQDNVKRILDNNDMATEEKEILLQSLRERRRTDLALNAMDSGTIDMLKGYLEDDNVKQALIDKGVVTKEQADDIQREDIEAIQKVQDKYDDNVRRLNAISRNIYAKNGTHIPTEYLQIIARNNIAAQLTVENYQRKLASWSEDATNLQHDLEENDKIDKNINYKEAIRLRWLSEKLGQLEADKKAILDNKKLAKSISGQEKVRELDANIDVVKKQVAKLNPENTIENLLFAIQTSLGYEKFNGEYLETGRRKEYADFTRALLSKDTKYFEKLDDRLVGIEERHFGAKDVLSQNMSRALAKSETNISNISKELSEAYATLASLQYMIDAERTNIKLNDEEVEKEAGYIHNYMNEVRKQKIADSKEALKGLADRYGSENIRNLVTQRYNGQALDYNNINISDDDKQLLNDTLDTLHLDEKLNSDLASAIDVMLATHDDVKAAQDAKRKSETIESSSASQEQILDTNNQNRDNPSPLGQQPEKTANPAQTEANKVQTNPQPSQPQSPNPSGLNISYVSDEVVVKQNGNYQYLATDNPTYFKVDFTIDSANVKHFNNFNLFTQEQGVDLTADNYIVGKKPIIDAQGNVIEKGTLVLNTPENNEQANINTQEDDIEKNNAAEARISSLPTDMDLVSNTNGGRAIEEQLASTGEVVRMQPAPEQVAGVQEEKPAEDTSRLAEMPYDANDVKSRASQDMLSELGNAIANNTDIDWDDFRKRLNTKYQPEGNTSQAITKDIESVIRAGKSKAERRGIKSFDAVVDAMAKASRLRENTSNEDAKKEFSDSVQNLLDVFNSEVGIDIVNGKKYINIEALCRYCDKILNDKLSAGLLLNNLIELTKDTKKYCVTDVNTDKIKDKLRSDVNSFDLSNGHLGIDYLSMLRQAELSRDETARAAFYEVIDNIQPGDKIDVERDDNDNGGLVFRVNGVKIGSLPYPHVSNNRTLYQDNDNWNTDILFIQGGNVQSKLKDLFINWNNNLDNPDIRELNDIILQYMDPKYDGDKSELVKRFAKNKEVQKAIAQKYTVDNPNYETLLKGITKIWRYTRTFGDFYEGDVVNSRAKAITRWFTDRVAPSFNFIQRVKENPNIEVEVETITEGELIIERDESKRLPVSKAIGTNYKGKIRLGIAQEPTNITIGGNGINGSTNLRYSKAGIGNTFVIIPARNGDHQVVRAYRQKVSSDNISKTAKDIKNAIYSEIRRICSDDKSFQEDKLKTLEAFLRKVLPVYTTGTNKPNVTASFFDADSLAETNLTIGDNVKNARGYTISYRQSKDAPNIYLDVWNNGTTHRTENGIRTDIDINTFAEEIIKGIETCGTFNLSFAAINSDLSYAERQYLTRRDDDGKYIISIPNHEPFVFNSYSDFILDNDLVTLTTRPTADGKSNFNRLSDRYYANQQLYVKIINETTSPVEESVEESTTTPTVANPRETEILDILNSKRIKNKAEKLADLLFGKKVRKILSFGKKEYKLFPKNIIFVDEKLDDNALVNTDDRPLLHKNTQILIPAKTVVLGREWLEMATSSNEDIRKEAAKKLLHEQLHILLSGKNQKYVEQIREVFNEFAEKNTDEEVSKYLFTDYKEDYYSHPVLDENGNRQYDANGNIIVEITDKLNQDGLEEFLVESLTSNKLARALNNIDSNIIEDKTKKKTLLQRIFEIILDMLNITYTNEKGEEVKGLKQGSLYEKEFKLLRDVLSSDNQLEINFEAKAEESNIETSTEKAQEQEYNDEVYDEFDDLWDSSNGDSLLRSSRIKENTSSMNDDVIKLQQSTIIWAHPAQGKTYLAKQGRTDIIDFDTANKPTINEKMGYPKDYTPRELQQRAKNEGRIQEYRKYLDEELDKAIVDAKKNNKKLLISDLYFLRTRKDQLDSVITMSREQFLKNSELRNETADYVNEWKTDIDTAVSKVSKAKVIYSDKFLSQIFDDIDNTIENQNFVEAVTMFLNNFGITLQDVNNYNGDVPLFDALNRVINFKSVEDISDGVGEAIAFMMQYDSAMRDLIAFGHSNAWGEKGLVRKSKQILLTPKGKNAKLSTDDIKKVGKEISKELRNFYNLKPIEVEDSFVEKVWKVIERFFKLISDPLLRTRITRAVNFASSAKNAVVFNDKNFIIKNYVKPGTVIEGERVSVEEALQENPYEEEMITKLNKHDISLAGGAAIAAGGTIYRPKENPLHDLDMNAVGLSKERIDDILEKEFNHFELTNTITDPNEDKQTLTYLILDRPFKQERLVGEEGYQIIDENGKVIGYRIGSDLNLKEGVKGKMLDFFIGSDNKKFENHTISMNGKTYLISDYREAMAFKIDKRREKDIFDYNRFVPIISETIKEVPSISTYISYFSLSEQSQIVSKINNGKIRSSCK